MPRKRKYDYQTDYPVTLFIKIPGSLEKKLLENYSKFELNSKIVEYLKKIVENEGK